MSTAASAAERANPGALPKTLWNVCLFFVVLGVVAFVGGLIQDPQTAWLAYQSNFIFFSLLACGGLTLAAIYSIVGARWPGPYRRFAESLGAFVPISPGARRDRRVRRRLHLRLAEERRDARQGALAEHDALLRHGPRSARVDVDPGLPLPASLGATDAAKPRRERHGIREAHGRELDRRLEGRRRRARGGDETAPRSSLRSSR